MTFALKAKAVSTAAPVEVEQMGDARTPECLLRLGLEAAASPGNGCC